MKRVSFHELAERELNDAALYYEQESTGLGVKFLDEVEGNIGHRRSEFMWNSTWIACMLTAGLLVSQQTPYERSDGSWLDAPMEWNLSPTELLRGQPEGPNPKCDPTVRAPQSAAERLLTAAGWKLRTISEVKRSGGHSIEIVQAFRQFDGMCRDLQAQAFVFVNDRLVGTLSPRLMNARADGQLAKAVISESGEITATFLRYNPTDALCCPSRESLAVYSVMFGDETHTVKLLRVETKSRPVPR